MKKPGTGRFHKEEEILRSVLSTTVEKSAARSLESGFTRHDYEQIESELLEVYNRLKVILEKLVYSDSAEYFRLAKILDHAFEELRVKVHNQSVSEFQKPSRAKEKQIPVDPAAEDDSELSWKLLCDLEPELVKLWAEARDVKDTNRRGSFCSQAYFSEHFIDRLSEILGPWTDGTNPKLKTVKALDLAKSVIIDTLPPCRDCKKHPSDTTESA